MDRDVQFPTNSMWFSGHWRAVSLITPGHPRIPQDTPGHPKTLQSSIICMFNILYERVDDGLVLVCWGIN